MTKQKQRPKHGDPIVDGMSERDIALALGVSRRWLWECKQLAELPEQEFEDRLAAMAAARTTREMDEAQRELRNVARERAGLSPRKRRVALCPHCGQPMPSKS